LRMGNQRDGNSHSFSRFTVVSSPDNFAACGLENTSLEADSTPGVSALNLEISLRKWS
jgi:hypothetical protein